MKRIISKRFLSLALAIIMVAALIPSTAFAAVGDTLTFDHAVALKGLTRGERATKYKNMYTQIHYWPCDVTTKEDATGYLDVVGKDQYEAFKCSEWGSTSVVHVEYNSKFYWFYHMRNTSGDCWPNTTQATIFNIKVGEPGMYKIKQSSLDNKMYSGDVAIYIDGQYAGAEYTKYKGEGENVQAEELLTTQLNTLKLTPDEDGFVEVAFRPIGRYDDPSTKGVPRNLRIYPIETVFEEAASLSISDIEYKAPSAELAVGTTTDPITAKVKMSDGNYRFFHTHNGAKALDTANGVFVTSSDDTVVSVSERTIKDTDTTFSLTALKPGTATITVTAKVEGTTEPKVESFDIVVPGEETEEPETVSGNVSFGAYSEGPAPVVTIDDEPNTNVIESVAVGSTVKAVADTTNPNYKFLGWKRGSRDFGVWLTEDATVEFPIMTNTFLTAVYEPVADEAAVNVEFYNYKGQYLDTAENVGDKAFSAITKPTATLTGYSFPFWTLDGVNAIADETTFTKLTRVVAKYNNKENFTVTIGEGITGATTDEYDYDTELNLSATSDGTWYVNEKPVAYGASYKHCVWDTASITFKAEETIAPIISIDSTKKTNGARMISYDANGKEIVEVGILFGDNASLASCNSKAASKATGDAQGQFTAMPNGTETTARGYLIYNDNGTYKVIYAD